MDYSNIKLLHMSCVVISVSLFGLRGGQAPWTDAWLAAKVLGLLAYIGLRMQALSAKTPAKRRPAYFAAALLSVTYIVGVALTRSPHWGLM